MRRGRTRLRSFMNVRQELLERWKALPERARWSAFAALALIALFVGAATLLPWLAARAFVGRVEARGLVADVGSSRIGLLRLWFRDVRIHDPTLPELVVRLDAVQVRPTLGSGLAVAVHGGLLTAEGVPEERLRQRLRELRGGGAQSTSAARPGAHRSLSADGIAVAWSDGKGRAAHVWGGRFVQQRDGALSVAVDMAKVAVRRIGTVLRGVEGQLDSERVFTSLEVASVAASVELGAPAEPRDAPELGDAKRGARPSDSASQGRGSGGAEQRGRSPSRGRGRADSQTKGDAAAAPVAVPPEPGEAQPASSWAEQLASVAAAVRPHTSERFRGSVLASSIELRRGTESLRVGPSRLDLKRDKDGLAVELLPSSSGEQGGTPLSARARVPFAGTPAELELSGGPVSLSALGVREHDFGLLGVRETRLEAQSRLRTQDFSRTELSSKGTIENLRLRRPALAPGEISAMRLGWRFDGALGTSSISLREMELALGDARVNASGEVSLRPERQYADLRLSVPLAACNALLSAVPRGMAPLIEGVKAEGTFALDGSLFFDSQKPGATRVTLRVDNRCRIREVPPAIAATRFRRPWLREVKSADGSPMTIESGPSTADWAQYEDISPFMETAVLVCEDGHFFGHHGFDYNALENSIRMNLESGRFLRGGSTVSMQLAKNLYLSKEKTISRKLQEAVLTMLLEQQLSKHEIMELYLNVIEFGPGIYGIRQATRYYFNEEPRDLSLGQALYLASILPAPDTQHFLPDGRVSDGWSSYLQKLMHVAKKIRRITDEELAAGLAERVQFRSPNQLARAASDDGDEARDDRFDDDRREEEP